MTHLDCIQSRYQVRAIASTSADDDWESAAFCGTLIGSSEDYSRASALAKEQAYDYHYGTVVIDTEKEIIDWGDGWTDYEGNSL